MGNGMRGTFCCMADDTDTNVKRSGSMNVDCNPTKGIHFGKTKSICTAHGCNMSVCNSCGRVTKIGLLCLEHYISTKNEAKKE